MKQPAPLDKYIPDNRSEVYERFNAHLKNPDVSINEYREVQREKVRNSLAGKKIIYLDTNAWKCLSDYERGKSTLSAAMQEFAALMNSPQILNTCVFPIGTSTMLELQSMTDPETTATLTVVVDRYSKNVAIKPPDEVITQELALFNRKETRVAGIEPNRFCHPMDLMGGLELNMPKLLPPRVELALKKALMDNLYSLPLKALLEMSAGKDAIWDNTAGIDEMNEGKFAHQHEIKSFVDALFVELAGVMRFHVPDGPPVNNLSPAKAQAAMAMIHWKDNPRSRGLITARVLANLHAFVRYIENRKFRQGDIADFSAAQAAVPSAHAFFTDKALANLLMQTQIQLKVYSSCDVLFGFDNFTAYLKNLHS
jgi:hypothetical protein